MIIKNDEKEWDQVKLNAIKDENKQLKLFEEMQREIKIVKKLPYKFSYRFIDDANKEVHS